MHDFLHGVVEVVREYQFTRIHGMMPDTPHKKEEQTHPASRKIVYACADKKEAESKRAELQTYANRNSGGGLTIHEEAWKGYANTTYLVAPIVASEIPLASQ